jgi:histidine triad (HIT) family protein
MSKTNIPSSALEVPPEDTLFAKMVNGTFKCDKVYEDDHVLAFRDINPQAPTHFLLVPKNVKIGQVDKATDADALELGHLYVAAGKIAKQYNLLDGYRLVVNQGLKAQQSVNYLHVHMLAGRQFHWPPG